MSRGLGLWAKLCFTCQRSKISTHVHSPIPSITVPIWRFSHFHIHILLDLYLPASMMDRTTRWPKVFPLSSISAESCVCAFLTTWVSRFRVPAVLTSDQGSQFTSAIWSGVCSILGILASTTTSFHPQSSGLIERFHRSLKSTLRARSAGSDWFSHLPLDLLGLRATPKEDMGLLVSEAVCGSPLILPGELMNVPEMPPCRKMHAGKSCGGAKTLDIFFKNTQ